MGGVLFKWLLIPVLKVGAGRGMQARNLFLIFDVGNMVVCLNVM